MTGPLVPYQEVIWKELLSRGYTRLSAKNVLRLAAHLSRWLQAEGLSPEHLTRDRIDAFLRHRRTLGYTCWLSPRGLEPILRTLRAQRVVPPAESAPEEDSPLARLLREYERYLVEDRSVSSSTAGGYVRTARRFFTQVGVNELADIRRLSTAHVSGFVLREASGMATGTAKLMVTGLRALLRYLHVHGLCGDLSGATPAVAGHRQARLPKHIPWSEVEQLLRSCDLRTAVGRRDQAILLLLAHLGLRAGEVAALELGDVDWIASKILVRGKGAYQDWLPLPADVGEAIVRYLKRGRPSSGSRKLFLMSLAPYGELSVGAINVRVRVACHRARLTPRSAHQLRHTAATQMLRGGASLEGIAEVLRHRSLDTTAIYAKVDHLALRTLVRPWPGGAS
ncbi:MAG TPA: tyrosine-type recombinase/integrase [Actinomycetota bacterium]|nr:tyrosine-type recombinase/integrase [Actinomycetota bacterium]